MSFGLSLAGGGIKGAAHIGVLKVLEEENIKIDYIAGTSSGSIVAALYAMGFDSDEIYKIFKKYCKKIKYVDLINIIKLIFGLIIKREIIIDGLNSGKEIEKLINKMCKQKEIYGIEDIKMPLAIPTVDMCDGKVMCFTSCESRKRYLDNTTFIHNGDIGKIVRASCSYPVVFSPCKYKGTKLIDGGIRENIPWKELKEIGADKILSVVFEDEFDKDCDLNIIEVASRSINLICKELANYELDGADYLLKIKSGKVGLLDIKKMDELYEIGYKTMKKKLGDIRNIKSNKIQ